MHVCVGVCVAKPVAVELRCHATALILVIGKAQFRRAMLSCDSSCYLVYHVISPWGLIPNLWLKTESPGKPINFNLIAII